MIDKEKFATTCKKVVTTISETLVIVAIGFLAGAYFGGAYIAEDCSKFNIAKTGSTFIQCTTISSPKDAARPE